MSELPEDPERMTDEPNPSHRKDAEFSEVYARTFDQAEDDLGPPGITPAIVIQKRRPWFLIAIVAPLLIILPLGGFISGRRFHQDQDVPLTKLHEQIGKDPRIAKDGERAAVTANGPIVVTPNDPETRETKTIPTRTGPDLNESGKLFDPGDELTKIDDQPTRESFRDASFRDLQDRIAEAAGKDLEQSKLAESAEERRGDEDLADQRLALLAANPLSMDRLHELERERLHRDLSKENRNARDGDLSGDNPFGDTRGLEQVWRGERTYRRGLFSVKTVQYELHVSERNGHEFRAHKFDNGRGQNRVEVEGWVVGNSISWIETHEGSSLRMKGHIARNRIEISFEGIYANGRTNVGDGWLTLSPSMARRDEPPVEKAPGGQGLAKTEVNPPVKVAAQIPGATPVTVMVPGTANPYLADRANRSLPSDAADGTFPPIVEMTGGKDLSITVTGGVKNAPTRTVYAPDGGPMTKASYGARGGISSWKLPISMAAGVFTGDEPTPAPELYSTDPSSSNASPMLGQVFPIGDGFTGTGAGARQVIRVPSGAKRLHLAVIDGARWDDNGGEFHVTIGPISEVGMNSGARNDPRNDKLASVIAKEERERLERSGFELYQRGVQLNRGGEFVRALEKFEQAEILLNRCYPEQNHPSLVSILIEQGMAFRYLGKYSLALERENKAYIVNNTIESNHDNFVSASILNNIGMILKDQEHYKQSLNYFRKSLEMNDRLAEKKDGHLQSAVLNNFGSTFDSQGEYTQALDYYRQAIAINERLASNKDSLEVAVGLSNIGVILQKHAKYSDSLDCHKRSLAMKTRIYSYKDHPSIAKSLSNVGFVLLALDDAEAATGFHKQALSMRKRLYQNQDHPEIARSLDVVALCDRKVGHVALALDASREALEMSKRLYPPEVFRNGHKDLLGHLAFLGSFLHDQGDDEHALPLIQDAVAMEQALSAAFFATASEAEALNFQSDLPSYVRHIFLSIARRRPTAVKSAYSSLWSSKARVSRMVQQRQQSLIRASDPETQDVGRELNEIRHQLSGMLLAPAEPSGNLAVKTHKLADKKELLERRLGELLPEFRSKLALVSRPAEDLSRCLPKGMVFIDIFHYVDHQQQPIAADNPGFGRIPSYVAFVVRPGREIATVYLGPSRPINEALAQWREQLLDETKPDVDAVTFRAALRSLIWEKIEPLFLSETTTILVSPDSALTGLPWGALPGRQRNAILLEDYAISTVPSGIFLLDWLETNQKVDPVASELLSVGDVAYNKKPLAMNRAIERQAPPSSPIAVDEVVWPALEATKAELATIASLAHPRLVCPLTGDMASTDEVIRELPKARWAHLATHGFYADPRFRSNIRIDESQFQSAIDGGKGERFAMGSRSPMVLSGLVLAGANLPRRQDEFGVFQGDGGILTAESIAGLPLQHLELVVLSACETGLGDMTRTEGVFGLQRAFHTAGARNVVASLWNVRSKSTAVLMKIFYRKLWGDSNSPIDALRWAQLELYRHPELIDQFDKPRGLDFRKTGPIAIDKRKSNPTAHIAIRDWAGFIISGPGK